MNKLVLLLLTSSIILLACSKDNKTSPNITCGRKNSTSLIISADLLNCKYKYGSYWNYIDSVTMTTDSLYVNYSSQDTIIEPVCNNRYEGFNYKVKSSITNDSMNYIVVSGGLFKGFNGNANSGTKIYSDYNNASSHSNFLATKHDSIVIYNSYYYNVLEVEIKSDPNEGFNKSIYYINSDFGFLKHKIYSNSTLITNKILLNKNIVR